MDREGAWDQLYTLGTDQAAGAFGDGISQAEAITEQALDPAKQADFIKAYDAFLRHLVDDEAVTFADVVHPTHEAPGWMLGAQGHESRDRLNIHGAIDLETGKPECCKCSALMPKARSCF